MERNKAIIGTALSGRRPDRKHPFGYGADDADKACEEIDRYIRELYPEYRVNPLVGFE